MPPLPRPLKGTIMGLLAQRFSQEHREFLQQNHPRLYRNLSQSGKLQARLDSTGEQASEMVLHEMSKKLAQTRDLDPLEREKQLHGHREAMMELARHDLIYQPIPEQTDE